MGQLESSTWVESRCVCSGQHYGVSRPRPAASGCCCRLLVCMELTSWVHGDGGVMHTEQLGASRAGCHSRHSPPAATLPPVAAQWTRTGWSGCPGHALSSWGGKVLAMVNRSGKPTYFAGPWPAAGTGGSCQPGRRAGGGQERQELSRGPALPAAIFYLTALLV